MGRIGEFNRNHAWSDDLGCSFGAYSFQGMGGSGANSYSRFMGSFHGQINIRQRSLWARQGFASSFFRGNLRLRGLARQRSLRFEKRLHVSLFQRGIAG
jgi:hypothetical protein